MKSTARLSPCRENGDECRPAPDIIAPLVGSKAALDIMADDALRNPDSQACAYTWVPATITTDGYRRIIEGQTLPIMYKGEMRPAVVLGAPVLNQTGPLSFQQTFKIMILLD